MYYNENRNKPYVQCSGDYDLSITRFQLDTQTLPIFIPIIQPNQPDRDLTAYSITMSYGALDSAQTFISWIPQDTSAPLPPPPNQTSNGFADNSQGYYNSYNFQWLIYLVNGALADCYASLLALSGGTLPLPHLPPLMTWDTQNKIACISAPTPAFNGGGSFLYNRLYFNAPLFTLFSTFVSTYNGYTGVVNGKNNQIILEDFQSTNTVQLVVGNTIPPTYATYLQMYQEQPSITSWSPIASIVFCSSTLPLVPNNISAPLVFQEGQALGSSNGNNSNISQVLTDFCVGNNGYTPYILYNPTAEYRRVSLFGNAPLTNFDLTIFWKDRLGNLHPLLLSSGGSCNIKILFEKTGAKSKIIG